MGVNRESDVRLFRRNLSWDQILDADERQRVADIANGLGVQMAGDAFFEGFKQLNSFAVSGESTILPEFSMPHGSVAGVNYQIGFENKPLKITQPVRFLNTTFRSLRRYDAPRIQISGENFPLVMFTHCTFVRDKDHGAEPFVEIADGARVLFVGCSFISLDSETTDTLSYDVGMIKMLPAFTRRIRTISTASSTVITTASPHGLDLNDYIYIEDANTSASISGVQRVSEDTSSTQFKLAVNVSSGDLDRGKIYKFTGPNTAGHTAYTELAAGTLTYTQLIGCSRYPVGYHYTTTNHDPFITKIGCI